jgi:hypothetical protein
MKPLGEANLTVKNPSTGDERIVALIVVPNGLANLLGFRTVQNMGLITVNNDRFIANVVVQEIGDLGVATLQVNDRISNLLNIRASASFGSTSSSVVNR